jgi:hypothetical protein
MLHDLRLNMKIKGDMRYFTKEKSIKKISKNDQKK